MPVLAVAAIFFLGGAIWSIASLDLAPGDIAIGPLAILLAAIIPATLAYSAVNLMLMARAAGTDMTFADSLRTNVFASLAELLPVPGGAIVRSHALVKSGSKLSHSVELVVGFGLLWIACAAVGAALSLQAASSAALPVAVISALATLVITGWIAARFGFAVAMAALALRILGLGLMAVRVGLAFAAIGLAIDWSDTLAFTFAIIAGTASAIVPSGLGVSEGLAAIVAAPANVAPAGAFLAVALSRLLGLAVNAIAAGLFSLHAMRQAEAAGS